jgi:hypothetical protein
MPAGRNELIRQIYRRPGTAPHPAGFNVKKLVQRAQADCDAVPETAAHCARAGGSRSGQDDGAVGAELAAPERTVVALTGNGSSLAKIPAPAGREPGGTGPSPQVEPSCSAENQQPRLDAGEKISGR